MVFLPQTFIVPGKPKEEPTSTALYLLLQKDTALWVAGGALQQEIELSVPVPFSVFGDGATAICGNQSGQWFVITRTNDPGTGSSQITVIAGDGTGEIGTAIVDVDDGFLLCNTMRWPYFQSYTSAGPLSARRFTTTVHEVLVAGGTVTVQQVSQDLIDRGAGDTGWPMLFFNASGDLCDSSLFADSSDLDDMLWDSGFAYMLRYAGSRRVITSPTSQKDLSSPSLDPQFATLSNGVAWDNSFTDVDLAAGTANMTSYTVDIAPTPATATALETISVDFPPITLVASPTVVGIKYYPAV